MGCQWMTEETCLSMLFQSRRLLHMCDRIGPRSAQSIAVKSCQRFCRFYSPNGSERQNRSFNEILLMNKISTQEHRAQSHTNTDLLCKPGLLVCQNFGARSERAWKILMNPRRDTDAWALSYGCQSANKRELKDYHSSRKKESKIATDMLSSSKPTLQRLSNTTLHWTPRLFKSVACLLSCLCTDTRFKCHVDFPSDRSTHPLIRVIILLLCFLPIVLIMDWLSTHHNFLLCMLPYESQRLRHTSSHLNVLFLCRHALTWI